MNKRAPIIILFILAVSCNKNADIKSEMELEAATSQKKYTNVKFDSEIDMVCNMSLQDGISDTIHYKGKIYGFCIARCKSAFLSNPSAYSK
jgi:YHS domain-containing protein